MEESFYKELLENLYDGVYYVDKDRKINFWNKGAEKITGYTKKEVLGRSCQDNILRHITDDGKELCVHGCPLEKTLKDGKIRDSNVYLHHKTGHRVPVAVKTTPIKDKKGHIIGSVEIFSDNSHKTEFIKKIKLLQKEAFTDPLTQIGNRKMAEMTLDARLSQYRAYGISFGVLFLDIDHFKQFNDTYGHHTGDDILKMTATTIGNVLRSEDMVCRWGGEEFVIIAPDVSHGVLGEMAERVRFFIEKTWVTVKGKHLSVTISIGGTLVTANDTRDLIIERADALMYDSKNKGRNCFTIQ